MSDSAEWSDGTTRLITACITGGVTLLLLGLIFTAYTERTLARDLALECVRHHTPDRCEKLVEALP